MELTQRSFRDALGCFATGVTVITVQPNGESAKGMTVNSFSSVSLDPPLVSWCLDNGADLFQQFASTDHFAVSVLCESQQELSNRFAAGAGDRFQDVPVHVWKTGAPLLSDGIAHFDCETIQRIEAGDHQIYIGRVIQMAFDHTRRPLLFWRGQYQEVK